MPVREASRDGIESRTPSFRAARPRLRRASVGPHVRTRTRQQPPAADRHLGQYVGDEAGGGTQMAKAVLFANRFMRNQGAASARDRPSRRSTTGHLKKPKGRVFRDCTLCPVTVGVPAGSFMMGSEGSQSYCDERPAHRVTIASPFAVGVYEVTFLEWDACVEAGGCGGHHASDGGWGRGNRPVMDVSWENAESYVRWLSKETGRQYRVLSEAEWEYVARAGTQTERYRGESEAGSAGTRTAAMTAHRATMATNTLHRWGPSGRTGSVCTTFSATSGSGRRIAGMETIRVQRPTEVPGGRGIVPVVCCATALGALFLPHIGRLIQLPCSSSRLRSH